jgi:hypothetical protein
MREKNYYPIFIPVFNTKVHHEACNLLEKLMHINAWLPQSECKKRLEAWTLN